MQPGSGAPRTEVEEVVASCADPDNGAGPLWCYGAPLIVRQGDRVFASVMETGRNVPPLCNTRWRLYRRGAKDWERVLQAAGFREREPCPLVATEPDRLLISVNPSTKPPGAHYDRCDPHLLQVDARYPTKPPTALRPRWKGEPHFTDHSYRGIAVDTARGDGLLLQIDARTSEQHWTHWDHTGAFRRSGRVTFPIRACYPQVALRDRTGHVMAIGDIVEPREEWRAYKREKTGAAWDYVFRRLFYTRASDIGRGGFAPPIEVDSVEATGGYLLNLDLWLDARGAAHLLYLKTNTTPLLRDRFFPGRRISTSLEHVILKGGKIVARTTLVPGGEGRAETPQYGRFHAAADGTLFLVYSVEGSRLDGRSFLENRLLPVLPSGRGAAPVRLALAEPFTTFFTATERGGSRPSALLDLFGVGRNDGTLRYARIRLGQKG